MEIKWIILSIFGLLLIGSCSQQGKEDTNIHKKVFDERNITINISQEERKQFSSLWSSEEGKKQKNSANNGCKVLCNGIGFMYGTTLSWEARLIFNNIQRIDECICRNITPQKGAFHVQVILPTQMRRINKTHVYLESCAYVHSSHRDYQTFTECWNNESYNDCACITKNSIY